MSKSLVFSKAPGTTTFTDGTTRYIPLSGRVQSFATEAFAENVVRDAGTFLNASIRVSANGVAADSTLTLRKSAVDTALVVTIPSSTSGTFENTTDSVSFAATDEADFEITVPAVAGTQLVTVQNVAVQFEPDTASNCVSFMAGVANNGISVASVTRYSPLSGEWLFSGTPTEANVKTRMRAAFIAQDFHVYISTNARTTTTTFKTRKNGADGGQSVSYAASATGLTEDTSGTDSLAVGDDFNYAATTLAGTESMILNHIGCSLVNTGGVFLLLAGVVTAFSVAVNSTVFAGVAGMLFGNATENSGLITPKFDFTASELMAMVATNTITVSPTVVVVRDGAADSSVSLSISTLATGLFVDSSNSVVITGATDSTCYGITTPNTTGAIAFQYVGMLGTTVAAADVFIEGLHRIELGLKASTAAQLGGVLIE